MCIAAYPFVGSVAKTMGRSMKLQKKTRLADVERRIREQHGDRDFVGRITKYDVGSFLIGAFWRKPSGAAYINPPGRSVPTAANNSRVRDASHFTGA